MSQLFVISTYKTYSMWNRPTIVLHTTPKLLRSESFFYWKKWFIVYIQIQCDRLTDGLKCAFFFFLFSPYSKTTRNDLNVSRLYRRYLPLVFVALEQSFRFSGFRGLVFFTVDTIAIIYSSKRIEFRVVKKKHRRAYQAFECNSLGIFYRVINPTR